MRYQKELAALQEYIAQFDPEEFTSSPEGLHTLVRTHEQMDKVSKLKARLHRKRQLADSFHLLLDEEFKGTDTIITQDEVDALLEGWALSHT